MAMRRFGPVQGAGTTVTEKDAERVLSPGALGVTAYLAVLERGDEGKLISTYSGKQFKKKCGGRIAESLAPGAAIDFWEHSGGAGELHLIRVTDGTGKKASVTLYSRAQPMRPVLEVTAHNVGRWGGRAMALFGSWAQSGDITDTTILPDLTAEPLKSRGLLANELKGAKISLPGVQSLFKVVSNLASTAAVSPGLISVEPDATMATDYATGGESSKTFVADLEADTRRIDIVIDDGGRDPDAEFSIRVYLNGEFVKVFADCSMDPESDKYVVKVVNEDDDNDYILVSDLNVNDQGQPYSTTADTRPASYHGAIAEVTDTTLTINPFQTSHSGFDTEPTFVAGTPGAEAKYRDRIKATVGAGTRALGQIQAIASNLMNVGKQALVDFTCVAASLLETGVDGFILDDGQHTPVEFRFYTSDPGTVTPLVKVVVGPTDTAAQVATAALQAVSNASDPDTLMMEGVTLPTPSMFRARGTISGLNTGFDATIVGDSGMTAGTVDKGRDGPYLRFGKNGFSKELVFQDNGAPGQPADGVIQCFDGGSTDVQVVAAIKAAIESLPALDDLIDADSPGGATLVLVGKDGANSNLTISDTVGDAGFTVTSMTGGTDSSCVVESQVFGILGDLTSGAPFSVCPQIPSFTLTIPEGTPDGAVFNIDYLPLQADKLKGGYLAPSHDHQRLTRFRIGGNTVARMTVSGGDMLASAKAGVGTLSVGGTENKVVTGVGTSFLSTFKVGDMLITQGGPLGALQARKIKTITSNTVMGLETAFSLGAVTSKPYRMMRSWLGIAPVALGGGYDGLAGITDAQYIRNFAADTSLFRRLKGQRKGLVKVGIPGVTSVAVQREMKSFCEFMNWQPRIEIPANITTEQGVLDFINNEIGRLDLAVTIFPSYAFIDDPDKPGTLKLVSVTGMVHGREAQIAQTWGGYHKAAAGEDVALPRVKKFPVDAMRELNEEVLNPNGINVLKFFGADCCVWGDRTLTSDPAWRWKHQREQMSHYENMLLESFNWLTFAINDSMEQGVALVALRSFFYPEWQKRAIRGDTLEDAVKIKIDSDNNTNVSMANGDLNAEISPRLADTVERFNIVIGKQGLDFFAG